MRKTKDRVVATLLGMAMLGGLLIITAAPSRTEVVKLQAFLKGCNEVPPNSSSDSGKVEVAFDSQTKS